MNSVCGFGGEEKDGKAFFVYFKLLQRDSRTPSGEVSISSGGDVVPFQPHFTSPDLPHKHISSGGFREGEIDGKPFLIFTLLSQTVGSGGDDLTLQPLFLCPSLRLKVLRDLRPKLEDDDDDDLLVPCNTSPFFPRADQQVHYLLDYDSNVDKLRLQEENDLDEFLSCDTSRDHFSSPDQQVRYLLHSDTHDGDNVCKLPVAPLFWCNNKYSHYETFTCDACRSSDLGTDYYLCLTCDKKFHKECVESPLEITHPSLPFLSFKLYTNSYGFGYGCLTNQVFMDPVLAMQPIPIVIDHTKRHPHPLTFFPKQASLPCDVCGLVKQLMPTYVCLPCVYVVHQECIYFPNVIKFSRHHHRIYLTSSLTSGNLSCGVCRRKVDNHYGAYSCNKCADYFVHTRCALRKDLWDGEDLEGVPEEPEIIVEPFETIADGIILHFSHDHHLQLEICKVYDEETICQACILPIYEGYYFSCMDNCDFILHETCANAPRKKHHALHSLPLTLKVVIAKYVKDRGYADNPGYFRCDACHRESCGFVYEVLIRNRDFRLDVRCASVSEPFEYEGHEHPLFLALTPEEEKSSICQICQEVGDAYNDCRKLNCIECNYIICFRCATLPYKAMYKHDIHFLTFWKGKEASDDSGWCEVCETKLEYSRKGGFYKCDDCCTTLHVDCLLGVVPYLMKPDLLMSYWDTPVWPMANYTMSRPLCEGHAQGHHCPYRVYFLVIDKKFCTLSGW